MTKRKLFMTLAFVAVFGACVVVAARWMLEHSEPYELARQSVADKLSVPITAVKLSRLGEFEYTEGDEHGDAHFILCAVSDKCFAVVAQKRHALWKLVDVREER